MHTTPYFTDFKAFAGISGISAVSSRVVAAAKTIFSAVKTSQPSVEETVSTVAGTSPVVPAIRVTAKTIQRSAAETSLPAATIFSAVQTNHATVERSR
jgi:hypothetical protein